MHIYSTVQRIYSTSMPIPSAPNGYTGTVQRIYSTSMPMPSAPSAFPASPSLVSDDRPPLILEAIPSASIPPPSGWGPTDIWWMGSNGYMVVDGVQVHKVMTVSQSKSGNVWIYSTACTGYTWSPLTCYTTDCTTALGAHSPAILLTALATLGAHSPLVLLPLT
jgi:hypothetical protein